MLSIESVYRESVHRRLPTRRLRSIDSQSTPRILARACSVWCQIAVTHSRSPLSAAAHPKNATIVRQAASPMRDKSTTVTVLAMTGALLIAAALTGCVSSQAVVVGRARPAISPDQVQ